MTGPGESSLMAMARRASDRARRATSATQATARSKQRLARDRQPRGCTGSTYTTGKRPSGRTVRRATAMSRSVDDSSTWTPAGAARARAGSSSSTSIAEAAIDHARARLADDVSVSPTGPREPSSSLGRRRRSRPPRSRGSGRARASCRRRRPRPWSRRSPPTDATGRTCASLETRRIASRSTDMKINDVANVNANQAQRHRDLQRVGYRHHQQQRRRRRRRDASARRCDDR